MAKKLKKAAAWYISSTGEGVSLTLKGVALSLIPIAIFIASQYNIVISQGDLTSLVENVSTAISAIVVVIGLIRKLSYRPS